ncbi:xanthine dehydrogenase family protein molybdopterin-binding subunit (plasmid) [Tistrella bauzanensis]|uniref:xanthine dehydrogenase family protein molybdopterin-binding subunit n=1 Tax=Tistrella TaxID=171436 RepID=UPI0031F6F8F3
MMVKDSLIGRSVPRKEDERLLRGAGRFVDDCDDPRMGHVAILRNPFPHTRILRIDASAALAMPGVFAVLTGEEVVRRTDPITVLRPLPGLRKHDYFAMAHRIARFEGEPIAAVLAADRYLAEDALEVIEVDFDPLPHVVDAESAVAPGAPVLHEHLGSNVLVDNTTSGGDVEAAQAGAVATAADRFTLGRVLGLAMETRGVVARYDIGSHALDIVSSNQSPHITCTQLATALRMPEGQIRYRAGAIGGSFGNKLGLYPEDIICALFAIDTGRPVKWIEDRLEHFRSCVHGREAVHRISLSAAADGTLLALDDDYMIDIGAYNGPWGPSVLVHVTLPGPYNIHNFRARRRVVATNKVPMGAYRGYGPPESNFVREVLIDRLARQLSLDPAAMRRANFVGPEQMPYTSASGAIYDSGNYAACFDLAIAAIGYHDMRERQKAARAEGRLVGIGLSCYVEHSGYGAAYVPRNSGRRFGSYEAVTVRLDASGQATVSTGIPNFGQSVETAYAQICAEALGLATAQVLVVAGDTLGTPQSVGAMGSRGTLAGGGAIVTAAGTIRAKILRLAAHEFQVDAGTLDIVDGVVVSTTDPELRMTVAEIAEWAMLGQALPQGEEPGLEATSYWPQPAPSFGFGTVATVVEVDRRSGEFKLERFLIAHDCGTMLNPTLVEGQVAGGIVQGLGATLMEEIVYDRDSGQMINGSMADYMVPTAADLPRFEMAHMETPSPFSPFGIKGVGESGVIGAAAAVANAIADALQPYGIEIDHIPIKPETIWRALAEAEAAAAE